MFFNTNDARTNSFSHMLSRALRTVPVISRMANKSNSFRIDVNERTMSNEDSENTAEAMEEDEEKDLSRFDEVCESIDFEKVPAFATAVRKSCVEAQNRNSSDATDVQELDPDCEIVDPPMYGSFHILFPLEFTDGVRWMLKVPAAGYRGSWDAHAANALRSEALTMRKLSTETSIPVPAMYSFDVSMDNELKCPFILMEYMNGTPLSYGWFNDDSDSLETFRARALESLAAAMVQLKPYTASKAGTPCFDDDGNIADITTTRVYDISTMYNRLGQPECDDEPPAYCILGPFTDMRDRLLHLLNRQKQGSTMRQGIYELCRLFIQWLPPDDVSGDGRFVLAHPDLDLQNVLVSEDGTLQGLIDWDGATTSSVSLGCQSYPMWLTHDWTSQMYNYDPETRGPKNEYYPRENTPEELLYYRNMYSQFMEEKLREKVVSSSEQPTFRPAATIASAPTRKSLIAAGLDAAANDPMCIWNVVELIFDEIRRLTAPKWEKLIWEEEEEWKEYIGGDDESSEANAPEMEDVCPSEHPAEDLESSTASFLEEKLVAGHQHSGGIAISPDSDESVSTSGKAGTHNNDASNSLPTTDPHGGKDELAWNQKCNREPKDLYQVQSSDEVVINMQAPVSPINVCSKECKTPFCIAHRNIKAPSTIFQISDRLRTAVDRLPSQETQNKRKWLRFPSVVCNASDHLRSMVDHLPAKTDEEPSYCHLPHALTAISDRLRTASEKLHRDGAKIDPNQGPRPSFYISSKMSGLSSKLCPSWIMSSRKLPRGSSLSSSISQKSCKAAKILRSEGIHGEVNKDFSPCQRHSGEKAVSWTDVAHEMEKRGITSEDFYQHCDRIAALVKELANTVDPLNSNTGVFKIGGNGFSPEADPKSPNRTHKTNEADVTIGEEDVQQYQCSRPSNEIGSKEICPGKTSKQESEGEANVAKNESGLLNVKAAIKEEGALISSGNVTVDAKEEKDEHEEYITYKTLDYDFNSGEIAVGLMNGTLHPLNRQRLREGFDLLWAIT